MVALYDYNPEVQSPQDNPDSELPFKKGQMLTVVGEMVSGQLLKKNTVTYILSDGLLYSVAVYFNELCCQNITKELKYCGDTKHQNT